MTLKEFQAIIAAGLPLEGQEMIEFMRDQSDESRKIQFDLNSSYHSPDEVRELFSRITGEAVDETFRMFYRLNELKEISTKLIKQQLSAESLPK